MNNAALKTMEKNKKHLVLVDGYGFVFRAYYSLPPLTRADGLPIGAVLGFTNMLLKLINDIHADNIAIILDAGSKTFRNEIYTEYKANRPPAPEDLKPQFPLIREAAEAMNLLVVEKKGYEADDIIATLTKQAAEQNMKVTIVSSDKDLMQLVNDKKQIALFDAMKNIFIQEAEVHNKFGVTPDKVIEIQSLIGDSSDNVPGVPGVGPKTAAELMERFGSLDNIFANLDKITQKKRKQMLTENQELAMISKELVTLRDDVGDIASVDESVRKSLDTDKLLKFLHEYELKSVVSRVEKQYGVKSAPQGDTATKVIMEVDYKQITDIEELNEYLSNVHKNGLLAIYPTVQDKNIISISLCLKAGEAVTIDVCEAVSVAQSGLFDAPAVDADQLAINSVITELSPYITDDSVLIIGYDTKQLMHLLGDIAAYDDVAVMSYVLEAGQHDHKLPTLCEKYFNNSKVESPGEYIDYIFRLHSILKKKLFSEHMLTIYHTIERPLVRILYKIEKEGIAVDAATLNQLSTEFAINLSQLEKEIHAIAGEEFNIGSPKQIGEILFDKLDLNLLNGKKPKKSKTGAYATGADILEELAAGGGHDIARKMLEWRKLSKLKSTYTDALVKQIAEDNRIHTNFSMTTAITGRLSSNDPNLQNIPIRTEEGYKIRSSFIAKDGYKLISADYSQIELRLLAELADIKSLKEAFKNNQDIHALTASQIFNIPLDEIDSATRRNAKAINFGIIYGISAFGLAKQLGISRVDAKKYIDAYLERYSGIKGFMDESIEKARENGYAQTLFGRKCYVKSINSKNGIQRSFGERLAINAPLQGSAADIIKRAMIILDRQLRESELDAKVILQVHDELLIEVKSEQIEEVSKLTKDAMEQAANLSVPLLVEVGIGDNWREIH